MNMEILDILQALGNIYEKEITVVRDLQRFEKDKINVFKYYCSMQNLDLNNP